MCEEYKGIFIWEREPSKRAFMGERMEGLSIAYEFPLLVSSPFIDEEKAGLMFFKSDSTVEAEAVYLNNYMKMSIGVKELDGSEMQKILSNRWIFQDSSTKEYSDFGLICFKTAHDGKDVFLYEDFFFENNIKATFPDGRQVDLCGIPFSEEPPIDHFDDNGHCDFSSWPFVMIENG